MKNPNPHDGYAPDLFSEHARAAQLGLRVLELYTESKAEGQSPAEFAARVLDAGSRLGLIVLNSEMEAAQ